MKSIRKKITICLMMTVLAAQCFVGAVSISLNYTSTISTVDQMMRESATLAAERVEQELMAYKNVAADTGCISQLSSQTIGVEEKRSIIDERVSMHNFQRGNIISEDGTSIFDGKDYSDREYVQQAMQGNVYVSEPLVSKVTGELSIMVAAPLYYGGIQGTTVGGVVYFVPHETFLNDIVSSIRVSENSRAYMINKSGDTIADTTLETVMSQNIENEAQSDSSLKELAAIHEAMRQGENGFGSYKSAEGNMFVAYAPVAGTDGWSIAITAPQSDYLATTYTGIAINIAAIIASILVSIIVALKLANNISIPMKACADRMKLLVEGDLESPVPTVANRDETGMLAKSTAELVGGLSTIIKDIGYLLNEMANQNLDIRSRHQEAYVGEFQNILLSMRNLKVKLSDTMLQINRSADQVSEVSEQVSMSAQNLSQGSVEQASSVEQLAARINEISNQAKDTAGGAQDARGQTHQAGEEISVCNRQMQELMEAMDKIQNSSSEIGKIIKAIEDIAFQTNILALNAAVEAARAGTAGKGFAVVAEQVKNLADESAKAAGKTTELIETTLTAMDKGIAIADETSDNMKEVMDSTTVATEKIEQIVHMLKQDVEKMHHVNESIEQVSSVVDNNSATSEETAAVSEAQKMQVEAMVDMMNQFEI